MVKRTPQNVHSWHKTAKSAIFGPFEWAKSPKTPKMAKMYTVDPVLGVFVTLGQKGLLAQSGFVHSWPKKRPKRSFLDVFAQKAKTSSKSRFLALFGSTVHKPAIFRVSQSSSLTLNLTNPQNRSKMHLLREQKVDF